jgi:hypothetical protein
MAEDAATKQMRWNAVDTKQLVHVSKCQVAVYRQQQLHWLPARLLQQLLSAVSLLCALLLHCCLC